MKPTNYTCPPAKKIADHMNVDVETAKKARLLMQGVIRITGNKDFPKTNKWKESCYHKPCRLSLIMEALNELLECHGVEALRSENSVFFAVVEWLNTGDTYSPTILFKYDTDRFYLTTWGDFMEANERKMKLTSF